MRFLKPALLILLTLAPLCLAAAPTSKPATPPATATAPADDPKAALLAFAQAMVAGDDKTMFDRLFMINDDAKKEAQATAGLQVYRTKFSRALDAEFKSNLGHDDQKEMDDIKKEFGDATVTITGDSAELKLSRGQSIFFVRDQGLWKIDFNKTQRAQEGPFDKERVSQDSARALVYKDLAADINAHKFKTRDEADAELQKRLDAVPRAAAPTDPLRQAAFADIAKLKTALAVSETDTGRYPTTAEGLAALLKAPAAMKDNWHGPYIDKVPADPWGHPYIYRCPGETDLSGYDLLSVGPDGQEGTPDDIARTTKIDGPAAAPATAPVITGGVAATAAKPSDSRSLAIAAIDNIKTALGIFETDLGHYPTTAEGLVALLNAPAAEKALWHGPYLEKLPLDPWGHPYIYRCPGTDDTTSFDLLSTGPDGKEGTADDITKFTQN